MDISANMTRQYKAMQDDFVAKIDEKEGKILELKDALELSKRGEWPLLPPPPPAPPQPSCQQAPWATASLLRSVISLTVNVARGRAQSLRRWNLRRTG